MNKIDNINNKKLDVSDLALEQMEKILLSEKKGSFIRLSVDSGGCSGFSYNLSMFHLLQVLIQSIIFNNGESQCI